MADGSAIDSIPHREPARGTAAPGNGRGPHKAGDRARRPQRLPRSLTPDERAALLTQPNERADTGVRDRALIAAMLLGGLRCAEALAWRPRDVDLTSYRIRVMGKGRKERVVPIDPQLETFLREWRARRPSGERFFNTVREPKGRPLDAHEVPRMVKRRGLKAGINDVHPHLLRHDCATRWISERDLELHEVQLLLGHARIRSLDINELKRGGFLEPESLAGLAWFDADGDETASLLIAAESRQRILLVYRLTSEYVGDIVFDAEDREGLERLGDSWLIYPVAITWTPCNFGGSRPGSSARIVSAAGASGSSTSGTCTSAAGAATGSATRASSSTSTTGCSVAGISSRVDSAARTASCPRGRRGCTGAPTTACSTST